MFACGLPLQTDAKIQESVRVQGLHGVRHRPSSRHDHDYGAILALDDGQLKEHGSGAELLEIEGGIFASLVEETGPSQAPRLRQSAREAAKKKAEAGGS